MLYAICGKYVHRYVKYVWRTLVTDTSVLLVLLCYYDSYKRMGCFFVEDAAMTSLIILCHYAHFKFGHFTTKEIMGMTSNQNGWNTFYKQLILT